MAHPWHGESSTQPDRRPRPRFGTSGSSDVVRLPVDQRSSHEALATPSGVTQAPRWRRRCGCSPAKKQARVSRIQANGRGRMDDYQHVAFVDEDFRTAPANRASAAIEPRSSRAVSGHSRLCKHVSSSRLVRHWTAAHERRPAVTWRNDPSLTVLVPDNLSHMVVIGRHDCSVLVGVVRLGVARAAESPALGLRPQLCSACRTGAQARSWSAARRSAAATRRRTARVSTLSRRQTSLVVMIGSPPSVSAWAVGACVRGELAHAREHRLGHRIRWHSRTTGASSSLRRWSPGSDAVRELAVDLEVVR
jgi:hypothetical protein